MADPTKPEGYEAFRDALALHESGGNPSAVQWDTKARGLFQFIPRWHADWIQKETGRTLDSFMPQDSSEAEMARAAKEQSEVLFPKYYERELHPFIKKAREAKVGQAYTDAELGAMAHFAGPAGAMNYLKTGKDVTLGTKGNAAGGIAAYVKSFNESYNKSPITTFEEQSKSAKHYGEIGLGRGVYEKYRDKDVATVRGRSQAAQQLYSQADSSKKRAEFDKFIPGSFSVGGRISGEFSGPPEALANENKRLLALFEDLAARLGGGPSEEDYLNRLRREGSGLG